MPSFKDTTEAFKIAKLLKNKSTTSKEAKERLNEMVTVINGYALAVLSEECKEGKNIEETIEKIFKTIDKTE